MERELPVFEFHERGGRTYKVWADGTCEGFGSGYIVNRILALYHIAQHAILRAMQAPSG